MTTTPQPAEKPKLRWYQYCMWHLFALMTLAAIGCSWFTCKMVAANKRREAVEAIEDFRGVVWYDYQFHANCDFTHVIDFTDFTPNPEPPGPAWFTDLVGVDFLADVVWVDFTGQSMQVTDARLKHLKELTGLKRLGLLSAKVSDAGLQHIKGLTNLRMLDLCGTEVSNAGLQHLEGLTNLIFLDLDDTQVTNDGVKKLQKALPNCEIYQ